MLLKTQNLQVLNGVVCLPVHEPSFYSGGYFCPYTSISPKMHVSEHIVSGKYVMKQFKFAEVGKKK